MFNIFDGPSPSLCPPTAVIRQPSFGYPTKYTGPSVIHQSLILFHHVFSSVENACFTCLLLIQVLFIQIQCSLF